MIFYLNIRHHTGMDKLKQDWVCQKVVELSVLCRACNKTRPDSPALSVRCFYSKSASVFYKLLMAIGTQLRLKSPSLVPEISLTGISIQSLRSKRVLLLTGWSSRLFVLGELNLVHSEIDIQRNQNGIHEGIFWNRLPIWYINTKWKKCCQVGLRGICLLPIQINDWRVLRETSFYKFFQKKCR